MDGMSCSSIDDLRVAIMGKDEVRKPVHAHTHRGFVRIHISCMSITGYTSIRITGMCRVSFLFLSKKISKALPFMCADRFFSNFEEVTSIEGTG